MNFTYPQPMVSEVIPTCWSDHLNSQTWKLSLPYEARTPSFEPTRLWPVQGLRQAELSALKLIYYHGEPMPLADFYREFTRGGPKAKRAVLHDLNRLGLVRIVLGRNETFAVEAIGPIDFDELERTLYVD